MITKKFGLLGEKLSHSFSPPIHKMLGDYEYKLYEKEADEIGDFLDNCTFSGMNVTIPYKKTVIPYCVSLSETAKKLGSVNTLVRKADGWHGDNTDYYGFTYMTRKSGIDPKGKKAVVLGSGGASLTVIQALWDMGAKEVVVISRTGENNYENISLHYDAEIIVNTTPVGMYPKNMESVIDLSAFKCCTGVLDLIYNPAKTKLLLEAEKLGIPNINGLSMLVAQAKKASELFFDKKIEDSVIDYITKKLESNSLNIVLVGMPGCGKSTTGKLLSKMLDREFVDCDEEIVKYKNKPIPEIFEKEGEEAFRKAEHEVIKDISKKSGLVIATGGGCVTREENYDYLHQNGIIFWIKRDIEKLPVDGRPLSQKNKLSDMYEIRKPLYERFSDYIIEKHEFQQEAAGKIKEIMAKGDVKKVRNAKKN